MTNELDLSAEGARIEAEIAESQKEENATAAIEKEQTTDPWGQTEPWLECPPWDGSEKSLPAGEKTIIPNFQAADLVRRWEVLDVEEDEGFRAVKRRELQPGDIIIGCQINEKAVAAVVATYGPRFVTFAPAGGARHLDRGEWRNEFGTDVLELQALKQVRQSMSGGGITPHPVR